MKINKNIMCTVLSFGLIASLGSGMAVKAEGEYQTTGEDYEINYIAINETGATTKALLDVVKMYQEQVNPNFKMNMEYINDQQARNQKIRTLQQQWNCRIGLRVILIHSMNSYGMPEWLQMLERFMMNLVLPINSIRLHFIIRAWNPGRLPELAGRSSQNFSTTIKMFLQRRVLKKHQRLLMNY